MLGARGSLSPRSGEAISSSLSPPFDLVCRFWGLHSLCEGLLCFPFELVRCYSLISTFIWNYFRGFSFLGLCFWRIRACPLLPHLIPLVWFSICLFPVCRLDGRLEIPPYFLSVFSAAHPHIPSLALDFRCWIPPPPPPPPRRTPRLDFDAGRYSLLVGLSRCIFWCV